MKHKKCWKIIAGVMLLIFLTAIPLFAEQPANGLTTSTENATRFYSEQEVEKLIDEISIAAHESIENAAGEAAKAAMLAVLEKEAAMLAEISRLKKQAAATKKNNMKNLVITGVSCFLSGAIVMAIISGA